MSVLLLMLGLAVALGSQPIVKYEPLRSCSGLERF